MLHSVGTFLRSSVWRGDGRTAGAAGAGARNCHKRVQGEEEQASPLPKLVSRIHPFAVAAATKKIYAYNTHNIVHIELYLYR